MDTDDRPQLIRSLLRPEAYRHPAEDVELIETHSAWVLLAGDFAYKVKKPVDLGFLDFSTLEKRRDACFEELRLNARYAPDLYLDVVGIDGPEEDARIGAAATAEAPGDPLEYAVHMRRFRQDAQLDRRLDAGRLGREDVETLARRLAGLHADLPLVPGDRPYGTANAVFAPVLENFAQIIPRLGVGEGRARLDCLEAWSLREGKWLARLFARRRVSGHVRECHGDLHLRNLVRLDDGIVPFDCLEFDPALRWIDVLSDLAFLAMDLEFRGAPELACHAINSYLETTGDYAGARVLPFYLVYRALVRAKVAAIVATQQPEAADGQWLRLRRHLDVAARVAWERSPAVVLTHGVSGSGKTHASGELVGSLGAIRVRSDVERKRLHGLDALERGDTTVGGGMYDRETTDRTYTRLLAAARDVVAAGFPVVLDACFLTRSQRDAVVGLAREFGAPWAIIGFDVDRPTLEHRIRARRDDASDAGVAVLEHQTRILEPLGHDERARTVLIPAGAPIPLVRLVRLLTSSP